jgi:hypothetical protein
MVITITSATAPHGPAGSFVVNVNVAVPAEICAALGVNVAFKVVALGENVPDDAVQVPEVAPPLTEPASVAVEPAQIV